MRPDGYESLSDSDDDGGMEGYVVDATAVNIGHWLSNQVDPTVAQVLLDGIRQSPKTRVAVLRNLWVEDGAQGQGQGRYWLDEFLDRARADVVLLVADAQQSQRDGFVLQRFYEEAGFEAVTATGAGPMMVYPAAQATRLRERVQLLQELALAALESPATGPSPILPSARPGR